MKSDNRSASSRFSLFAVLICAFVFAGVKVIQIRSEPDFIRESYAISWDAYGYYLHLPAVVIHRDPGMENRSWIDSLNSKYQSGRPWYQSSPGINNRQVNVYPAGTAICWLPFFLTAHGFAGIAGYPQDGLSPPYQYAIIFAGLFYSILGLLLLRRLLLRYASDGITALVLIIVGLGTNFFYYSSYDTSLPHILIFTIGIQIILLTVRWHETPRFRTAFYLGCCIGLVTIIRPTEIIWCLIPLIWNVTRLRDLRTKAMLLFVNRKQLAGFALGGILFGSIQLVYWKYSSGHWISNNHTEGFNFLSPFTLSVLFSYKKGWLLYTPLMIFALAGFVLLFRKERKLFWPLFIFFLLNLWIISSWECWWYGGSFSQRAMIQSYGILALPMLFLFREMQKSKKLFLAAAPVLLFLTGLNLFQSWQHANGILTGELNTREYYWKVFGRTEVKPEWNAFLEVDRENLPPLETVINAYEAKTLMKLDYETSLSTDIMLICDTAGFNSSHSVVMDQLHDFATPYEKSFSELSHSDHLRFRMSADVWVSDNYRNGDLHFVFRMIGERDQTYGNMDIAFDTTQARPGKWSHISADFITPHLLHPNDRLHIMSWNTTDNRLLLDNVEIVAYERK